MKPMQSISRLLLSCTLGVVALCMLVPLAIPLLNSFMTEEEIERNYRLVGLMVSDPGSGQAAFVNLKLLPDWVSVNQYAQVLIMNPKFLHMFWNSVALVVPIVVGQVIIGSLAAYAFAKLRFRGREHLFLIYLMTMLMPFQVTLVPNYLIMDRLGLLDSVMAIIWPGIFGAFGVFMMRQFMSHIPYVLMEAATIDGAGPMTTFVRVMLPLAKPGLAALTVLLFVDAWNMVEQPLIFLQDAAKQPLSLFLAQINQSARGIAFAASALYMAPMVLLFLYAESYFVEGIQQSGIKG